MGETQMGFRRPESYRPEWIENTSLHRDWLGQAIGYEGKNVARTMSGAQVCGCLLPTNSECESKQPILILPSVRETLAHQAITDKRA